ncbi:hypothetical protein SNOG_08747 [Parastagonospora nodorum SN15]|uniref:Uncharacterized protein n=1 Tax=Phaeosphaeria nodorum (strain SN15 / ATCC MYA-4574 / FGSC 10173) TaxID=321614 RepID=Q0UHL7_PHANO|nr:hypothetical protein SNOG_08747 [Parastagonospora nodorum SN15]EAT83915.1 hypothetical protein SNOG_08747 [Parastagonospora nodorum SN15]
MCSGPALLKWAVFERSSIKEVEVAESLLLRKPGPLTEVAGTPSRIHVTPLIPAPKKFRQESGSSIVQP